MYVLLVEDERRLSQLVRRVLVEEGHTVDSAFDGEEGLAMGLEGTHDVIVLDIMLPEKLKNLAVASKVSHQHVVDMVKMKRGALAQAPTTVAAE